MEPSVDKRYVFCAGTTGKDKAGVSEGMLAAIKFDRSLAVVCEQRLDGVVAQACTAMKRFKNRDDLVVGCFKKILFVRFTGNKFDILNVVDNVHSSKEIFD